jgi:hypothetical protein
MAVATETICFGDTSMYWTLWMSSRAKWPRVREGTRFSWNVPSSFSSALAWAMPYMSSSSADRYATSAEAQGTMSTLWTPACCSRSTAASSSGAPAGSTSLPSAPAAGLRRMRPSRFSRTPLTDIRL